MHLLCLYVLYDYDYAQCCEDTISVRLRNINEMIFLVIIIILIIIIIIIIIIITVQSSDC